MKHNEDLEEIEEIYINEPKSKKWILYIVIGVVAAITLLALFIYLSIPTYEVEEYVVSIEWDDDKDVYDCFSQELGHVYVSPDRVEIRYGDMPRKAIVKKVIETKKIRKEPKVIYTLYLFLAY